MTQAVLGVNAVASAVANPITISGAPIIAADVNAGEPTIEQMAASLPEPTADTATEAAAEAKTVLDGAAEGATEETAATEEVAAKPAPGAAEDVDRLERAAKAAAKAREGSRRYAETQRQLAEQAEQQRIQAGRLQQAARDAEQLRQENAAHREREQAMLRDPYATLKKAGATDVEIARRALQENTPEAVTARLEERLTASENRARDLERSIREERAAAQAATVAAAAESAFYAEAKNVEAYPELAIRSPNAQLVAARAALAQIRSNGHDTAHFTNEQIAKAADLWLAPVEGAVKKPVAAAPVAAKPAAKPTSGKTLTNAAAAVKTTATAAWDSLTNEQQFAHLAAQLPEPE